MLNTRRIKLILMSIIIGFLATSANAADVSVVSVIQDSMAPAVDVLIKLSITWLAVFAAIQFVVTNIGLLKSGADIEAVIGKLMGSLLWISFCIYLLLNGPNFIEAVGKEFFGLLGVSLPKPSSIITWCAPPSLALISSGVVVGGVGAVGSVLGGQILIGLGFFILSIGVYFAIKIYMIQLELAIVIMLSPLSFSFLGLNALKDQGIAPLKSLLSLCYRIILMTLIVSAFSQVVNVMITNLHDGISKLKSASNMVALVTPGVSAYGVDDLLSDIMSGLVSYAMLAYLLYKSDAIASSLAAGGTNMCVFQTKLDSQSTANWTVIPEQTGQ